MLVRSPLPIICATNPCRCSDWFVHLKTLNNHPLIKEDEKLLWLWLATQSADNPTFSCSFNYEQIAQAMQWSVKIIHRLLFRLKIMGFLQLDIPIWYGNPTPKMTRQIRTITLRLPERTYDNSFGEDMTAEYERTFLGALKHQS